MAFAEKYRDYTIEDWKKVWWSDETKINHLGSDERRFVWKGTKESLSNQLVEGTVKFGGGAKLREYEEPAGGMEELWRRVEVEWEKIPKEQYQKLIESMSRKVAAVLRAKEGYTKY